MSIDDVTDLAESALHRAFELDKDLAEAYASTGLLRFQQGHFEDADRELEQAIARAPSYVMAHMWYGRSLALQGRYREAIPTLLIARRLDPLSAVVSGNLGAAYIWTGEPDKARAAYQRAAALTPESSYVYQGFGSVGRIFGDFANSVHYYKKGLELAPNNMLYLRELAWAYVGFGYDREADELLAKAETIDPENFYPIYGRKLYYLETGRAEEFIEYTEVNLERRPENPFLIADAALARSAAGEFKDAVSLYERIGPSEEKFGEPLFNIWDFLYGYSHALTLIKAYQMTGDDAKAEALAFKVEEFFQDAKDRGISLPNSAYFQACLDALRGSDDTAIENLQRAYELGWRGYRIARHNPVLTSMQDNERFTEILGQAEADIMQERARFEATRTDAESIPARSLD